VIKEPKRMREEPSVLGESVAAVRERVPSDARLVELAARLNAAGAPLEFRPVPRQSAPAETAVVERPAPARSFAGKATIFGLVALGGLGLLAWLLARRPAHAGRAPEAPPVAATSARQPLENTTQPESSAVAGGVPSNSAAAVAPVESPPAPASVEAAPLGSGTEPYARSEAEPGAVASVGKEESLTEPGSPARAPRQADGRPPRRAPSGSVNAAAPEPTPASALAENNATKSELELLKEARSALAADPAQAFALTERCRAQYPSGELAQEREYIAISALVRLGRSSEAASRATLFRMHYPASAYVPRLSRLLGDP